MYLNFKKINNAKCDAPMLRLQTLVGKELGPVPFVHGLKLEINYSDLSTIEFQVPFMVNGMMNPLYAALTGYKVIYTDELGVYMITNPEKSGDGVSEVKQVKGYSLEYIFHKKNLYLDEGTYCFWNPIFPEETILGRIIELDPNWSVGYVAPRLMNCYRTFDGYDNSALDFCYGEAMEKYRCAIVFDVYNRTINAYDAGDDTGSLPIYLDYDNLVKDVKVTEDNENVVTKLHLYGGDGLSIRNVNPINGDYLIDLSFFLNNGDLDIVAPDSTEKLSDKIRRWRADILAQQAYYTGLVSLRSSMTAKKLTLEAQLNELKGQLQTLSAQQNVYIKELALEKTDAGKANKQNQLDIIHGQIEAKNREISAKEVEIKNAQSEISSYLTKIKSVSEKFSISGYFTESEQLILAPYLIEGEITEETFVSTDTSASNVATSSTYTGDISIASSAISRVSLPEFGRTMYTLVGGALSISNAALDAQIVRGTLDVQNGNTYTLTAYLGSIRYTGHDFSKGVITVTGSLSGLSTDVIGVTENSITQYKGTCLSFRTSGAGLYFTVAANDFQQYAVEMELYEFGSDALRDFAWPTYEFDINTANFLYHKKFEPFKNSLELGKSIHLQLGSEGLIHPKIIGVELDYDDITDFRLIFSNRYQRKDELEYLSDEVHSAAQTSSRFDASKYLYDRVADKMTDVDAYMKNMLDAATQTIKAAADQSVLIDGAGIHVTSASDNVKLRIVNGMIAMTNDNWKSAKLAIGRFYSKEHKMDLWGVNAELIAGTLLLGSSLYIQTQGGFFTVDDNGVYINALKFYINNGKNLSETLDDIDDDITDVSGSLTKLRNDFNSVTTDGSDGLTLNATDLKGVINATQAQMKSGGGNVLFDSDGMWLLNGSTKANSTKAIWMNENGILFGSGSRSPDPAKDWTNWTTAISHDGIVAENIAAGTLSGMKISGGEITIGKSSASDSTYFYVDGSGNLGIGRNTREEKGFNFYVDYNGNMYARSGEFGGKLVAATGTFSGALSAATGTFAGALSAATGTFAGRLSAATGTFSGSLSAVDGTFSGTLSAAKISGTLQANSGAEIVGPAIYVPSKSAPKFKVDAQGNVTMTGNLTLGSGVISWSNLSGGVQTTINNAASTANSASNAATNAATLAKQIANGTFRNGTFINGTSIYSPQIYADKFVVKPVNNTSRWSGGFSLYGYYSYDLYHMFQISYYQGDAPYVCFDSPASAYASWDFDKTSFYGTLDFHGATVEDLTVRTPSDRQLKNAISYDIKKYELFFDNLIPCSFRYNTDEYNRTHLGFIAQDVQDALKRSGLSEREFAGTMRKESDDSSLCLSYIEFIALNTHMIQKLHERIRKLEMVVQSKVQ